LVKPKTDLEIPSGGAVLAADCAGSGRPLICLHAGVADRRMFREQLRGLSDDMQVLAYDRRGYGLTRAPDEPFRHVDDLAAVVDAAGEGAVVLLGCSQGGRIAIDYTLNHPDRVAGLILIGTAISGAPDEPVPDDVKPLAEALDAAEEAEDIPRVNAIEANIWLDGPTSEEGRVSGPLRDLFLDMNRIALEHPELTQMRQPPSAYDRLSEIRVPTLLMHGSLDFDYIAKRHAHLARVLPWAEAVVFDGVAHLPPMEVPARVNENVRDFCHTHKLR